MATSFCLKIVTDEDLRDGKELPEPAVKKYGKCMANSIFLKVPNCGTSWPIELKKTIRGSRIWCQKGWKEFADFYFIDEDYFVMFSYEWEHSHFQVRIFHCNNMEIDYPIIGGGADGGMSTPSQKVAPLPVDHLLVNTNIMNTKLILMELTTSNSTSQVFGSQ